MDKLDRHFAWKHFVVGVVAIALSAAFGLWYGAHHPPIHPVPMASIEE